MQIRVYTLRENTNFAPHISGGLMSLANCMPALRAGAKVGEWVAGITPFRMGLRLAFLMRVNIVYSRARYWQRFGASRHDSIYVPQFDEAGAFMHFYEQRQNPWHGPDRYAYDVDVDRVLLSGCYFNFANAYDAWEESPTGLALPPQYSALLGKSIRGAGWFREVPISFLPWVTQQPTVALDTIDDFERQLP